MTASSCQARSNGAHIDNDTLLLLQHLSQIMPRQLNRSHIVDLKDLLNLLSTFVPEAACNHPKPSCIAQDIYLGTPVKIGVKSRVKSRCRNGNHLLTGDPAPDPPHRPGSPFLERGELEPNQSRNSRRNQDPFSHGLPPNLSRRHHKGLDSTWRNLAFTRDVDEEIRCHFQSRPILLNGIKQLDIVFCSTPACTYIFFS